MTVRKNLLPSDSRPERMYPLALSALGVVFGDIGTSPLYALRQCFSTDYGIAINQENVLGVLSLIFWALMIIISFKYVAFVMRADNNGEGGILALLAFVVAKKGTRNRVRYRRALLGIGIFGAALLYGDGMITPAISVLSAVEGLKVATPLFDHYVIPFTIAILCALFLFQRRGTGAVGAVFGPLMLLWFCTLAVLGARWVLVAPEVLASINPLYAVDFFIRNRLTGLFMLGAVFLVVTGGEALYADMGHFGKKPIRMGWFAMVLPALLINYFGQGALLLNRPEALASPFYYLAPSWGFYPLVFLATAATVIASQAIISGAYSLTRQAMQLGYVPRLEIRHSSPEEIGQVYVPWVNWVLLAGTVGLVLGFGSSANLAGAYGVAVVTTMILTTILAFACMRLCWGWSMPKAAALAACLLAVDLAFFTANIPKIEQGAWVPLAIAAIVYILFTTWKRGRALLGERFRKEQISVEVLLRDLAEHQPIRAPGTAVFMDSNPSGIPRTLVHNLKHNHVLHERVILLTVIQEEVPRIPWSEKLEIHELAPHFFRIMAHYGFMEEPNVPAILRYVERDGLEYKPMETTFFLGRETLVMSRSRGMNYWRKLLFALLSRNAQRATLHYGIPPNRAIEIGAQVEM
jgi:KUP system potassium uptake protein